MSPLIEIIAREARAQGVLPFSRFMELALYCPDYGFYEREKDIGRHGNFFTSVSVGPLFGQLLAFQFAEWLEAEVGSPQSEVRIVEAGAHDGKLAADILAWLQIQRPGLFAKIQYCIVEPSARRTAWQRATLEKFHASVHWFSKWEDLNQVNGIIFSNELLDAFPVQRLGWDAKSGIWFEWGVTVDDGKFSWQRMPSVKITNSEFRIENLPSELLEVLPDGFTTEICPAAESWWRTAANILQRGKLLTLDYGLLAEEFFRPGRSGGTLRAYHRHRASHGVLANVGEQDLTAQVNFTSLQSAGESAGLKTEIFATQTKFLTEIARKIWRPGSRFGEWSPAQSRQFQTLTHPEHLGRPFHALVQSKID